MNILVGKTIKSIILAADKKAIKFTLSDGTDVVAKTDGDCCSDSWIEHVENADAVIGSPVLEVDDVPMGPLPGCEHDGDRALTQCYGCTIKTMKGEMTLEYRNASNGYYGGELWWPVNDGSYNNFYGGVFGQNISKEEWTEVLA